MIYLENIHIEYRDKIIIENGEIKIPRSKLVILQGASGSGKKSLLYLLGLISNKTNCHYYYENQSLDLKNDDEKAMFRKQNIGYIFQDKNLHYHLTIDENLRLFCELSGHQYTEEVAKDMLQKVELDVSLDYYPNILSGGERQRLAIACILMKDPDLIIADEPTSSLDPENTDNIIHLFKKLANMGKHIVIATHSKKVAEQGDILYFIENREIKQIKGTIEDETHSLEITKKKIPLHFYFNYLKNIKKSKLEKSIVYLVSSIALSIVIMMVFLIPPFQQNIHELLNTVSDKQMVVEKLKKGYPVTFLDKEITYFKELSGVELAEPVTIYNGFGITYQDELHPLEYVIVPYFPQDIEEHKMEWYQSSDTGIYLSYGLAYQLGIQEPTTINIQNVGIHHQDYQVEGVFKLNVSNSLTTNRNIIYVPYEEIIVENPSQCIIYITDFQDFEQIRDQIQRIDEDFEIKSPFYMYKSMTDIMNQYSNSLIYFTIIFILPSHHFIKY